MKRFNLILAAFAIIAVAVGCKPDPVLTLTTASDSAVTFEIPGGTKTITFNANYVWTAASSESWVTVSPASGNAEAGSITLTAAANATSSERTATVTITMAVAPKHNNNGAKLWTPIEAIGGGPMIVYGGEDVSEKNYWKEVLDEGGTAGLSRQPRTCVAATGDGKVIFFVCDGRGENGSVGFTLSEMARKLIRLGATMAVNLDGGGSSVFVGKEGLVVNRPSDSKENVEITERKVTTAVTLSVTE